MKRLKILTILLMLPLVWACSKSETTQKGSVDESTAVKEAYLRVITALRKCDRGKLEHLLTRKTWAIATMAKGKKGDLLSMMCKNIPKGDLDFDEVTINGNRASLMVKIGNQPPKEVIMSKEDGSWVLGESGKVPAGYKKAEVRKPVMNPAIIKQQIHKPGKYRITNLHMGLKVVPGAARGGDKKPNTKPAAEKKGSPASK